MVGEPSSMTRGARPDHFIEAPGREFLVFAMPRFLGADSRMQVKRFRFSAPRHPSINARGGLPAMKSKFPAVLAVMLLTVVAPLGGALSGCSGADNPQIKEVPELKDLTSKIKPEPTKIGNKVVDYEKKSKYMEAMGRGKKQNP
jgi:hypothetical protein